jgi:hypothetical protein
VYLTGFNNDGFIVSTWGERRVVPYSDLKANGARWLINESIIRPIK